MPERGKEEYYVICYHIGFVYLTLGHFEKAYYYLTNAKRNSSIHAIRDFTNCLVEMKDTGALEYIYSMVSLVGSQIKMYGDEKNTLFPLYHFLRRRVDTLHTETPALPKELNDKLFYSVLEDYADITVKRERMKKMKADPHYNALQVKYAYAVTCHKAQGGQWKRVFLDQGYMTEDMLTPDYFRWLYTAFTRATEILYLVNWPKEQTE